MALLLASLPVTGRLVLGVWAFDGALALAVLCFVVGAYIHFANRARFATLRDPAAMLGRALELGQAGRVDQAIRVLTKAIHDSPKLWQAFQYRGELYLSKPGFIHAALQDFDEAIRLAPDEPHLLVLRARAQALVRDP
jgi:tetratricopeptide (TPR) repeat protein